MRELSMQELEAVNGGLIVYLADDGGRITAPGIWGYYPGMFGPPVPIGNGIFYIAECRP